MQKCGFNQNILMKNSFEKKYDSRHHNHILREKQAIKLEVEKSQKANCVENYGGMSPYSCPLVCAIANAANTRTWNLNNLS